MTVASGKYYIDTLLGNVFVGSTAVGGVVLPAYTTTAQTFAVWNPLGSGKNVIPISLTIGYVSTTGAAGNVVLAYTTGAGSQTGTGSPILTATVVAPVNAYIGQGNSSVARFCPAAINPVAAPALLKTTGISELVTTATTTSLGYFMASEYYDGALIVPPGVALYVAGNITLLNTMDITLVWEEV